MTLGLGGFTFAEWVASPPQHGLGIAGIRKSCVLHRQCCKIGPPNLYSCFDKSEKQGGSLHGLLGNLSPVELSVVLPSDHTHDTAQQLVHAIPAPFYTAQGAIIKGCRCPARSDLRRSSALFSLGAVGEGPLATRQTNLLTPVHRTYQVFLFFVCGHTNSPLKMATSTH